MSPRRCPVVFGAGLLLVTLGACAARPTGYFEASAGEPQHPAVDPARTAGSIGRYAATVEAMGGPDVRVDVAAQALDDLAGVVATLPGSGNAESAEAIRVRGRELERRASDPGAARHEIGRALATAANAFDAAARIYYPNDVTLARSIEELWSDIYPVVTDETQADRADVQRALTAMLRVLQLYEHTVAKNGG